jgi:hypothetical protein
MVDACMAGKTLLMIAYHFPPENAVGAARPFRFYKYAHRFGWEPLVVTAIPQKPEHILNGVHYIPDPFLTKPRSHEWHVERVIRRFAMPIETGISWSRHAARYCLSHMDGRKPDTPLVLYSTFPPIGTHFAAMQVLRKRSVCWVADFRDPYTTEPLRRRISPALGRLAASQIERQMVALPSLIIANTDAAAEEWKTLYPHVADKVKVIWNGYDPADNLIAPTLPERTRKILIHTGTLYGGRHAGPILASIARLMHTGRLSPASILVRFVGACHESTLIPPEVVESGLSQGWIEIVPEALPRSAALEMCHQSDGLFLIQPQSDTQVPGKLFDYVGIGRPILAFIRQNSPIEHVLLKCGIPNVCIYPDDTDDRVDEALLRFFALSAGPWKPSQWFQDTFDAIKQTAMLCSFIDEAIASPR